MGNAFPLRILGFTITKQATLPSPAVESAVAQVSTNPFDSFPETEKLFAVLGLRFFVDQLATEKDVGLAGS
jgi:hypothetical protein